MKRVLISLALATLVWIVFGQTKQFGWVRYDDNDYVYRSAEVASGLNVHNFIWAFTHFHASNWHPLTTLSLMADCKLFGVNPHAHHAINVILHALTAIALFFAFDSLTGKIWRSAFIAAVFAIHPLRAESVAWIAERKDVVSGLFFALTLLAWSFYFRKKSGAYYSLALLAAGLGLLGKPMLVTIPFVLLLIDYWPLARFKTERPSRLWLEKVPFLVLAAGSVTGTLLAQGSTVGTLGFPFALRLQNALVSSVIYLRQLFWPVDLAVLYPHPEEYFPGLIIVSCAFFVLEISVATIVFRRTLPFLFTGWFWYLGMLVPVIGIVQVGRQGHADRYTYLPLIGFTIAIVWLAAELTARFRLQKILGAAVGIAIVTASAACAYHQTTFWRDAESLWNHTLAVTSNNDGAHLAFATALFAEGKTEEAIAHMREAERLRPSNVGIFGEAPVATDEKQMNAAILIWSQRVQQHPEEPNAHDNLGALLAQKHQARAATEQWNESLRLSPNDGNAQNNLAWVLATAPDDSLRNGTRAVELAEMAMHLAGGANPVVARTLAAAYAEANRFDAALATAKQGRAIAEREGNRAMTVEFDSNIAQYERRLPLRDPSLRPSD